jgi:hypothetical protein
MLTPHLEHNRSSIPSTVFGRPGTWPTRKQTSRRKLIAFQIGRSGTTDIPRASIHTRFTRAEVAPAASHDPVETSRRCSRWG